MSLKVTVVGADNVPNPEAIGKCDPYAVVEFQGHHKKTQVIKGELNPQWKEVREIKTKTQSLLWLTTLTSIICLRCQYLAF
ncbi:myoferlin [Biomphalaria pfeifferi]|uniref:Myoferlin n=1 Tax=Biomphalaria pfeifferi TaxID=112525 RepID=A0AAD8B312_BIOPF|nr:myoferlin [Biomphalaria pfeifferi]